MVFSVDLRTERVPKPLTVGVTMRRRVVGGGLRSEAADQAVVVYGLSSDDASPAMQPCCLNAATVAAGPWA